MTIKKNDINKKEKKEISKTNKNIKEKTNTNTKKNTQESKKGIKKDNNLINKIYFIIEQAYINVGLFLFILILEIHYNNIR